LYKVLLLEQALCSGRNPLLKLNGSAPVVGLYPTTYQFPGRLFFVAGLPVVPAFEIADHPKNWNSLCAPFLKAA